MESKRTKINKTQKHAHRYREQNGTARGEEVRGWVKGVKGVRRYKLPGVKEGSPGDAMCCMVTTVHNAVLDI